MDRISEQAPTRQHTCAAYDQGPSERSLLGIDCEFVVHSGEEFPPIALHQLQLEIVLSNKTTDRNTPAQKCVTLATPHCPIRKLAKKGRKEAGRILQYCSAIKVASFQLTMMVG